jgi:glycosyltransferase involved in cell wall biosynthesis
LVSSQTLIPHGGIGQFTKSFCELMDQHNIKVDIITDKQPQNTAFINSLNVKIIAPANVLKYTDHSAIFMYGDTFCYERMANFRTAIVEALEHNLYDALICNTYETVQLASTMGLEDIIQIIAYTHLESQIFTNTHNPFLISTNEMMRKQLEMNALWIGTQSKFNQLQLQNAYELPIPLPEKDLLKEHHKPREGVLFIGRWEEGKNPELYLDLINQTKLPAKVMTSANGAKKFEARLKEIGVPYEIKVGIIGQEKVDFITSARVAFNPSLVESYGIAFLEQMTQMPTVALDNMRWTNNFNSQHFFTCTKQTMVSVVNNLYNTYVTAKSWYDTGSLKHTQTMDSLIFHKWNNCFNQFISKQSKSNTAGICKTLTPPNLTVRYADFIAGLQRRIICIDDARSVFTNKHKYRIIYTDDDTHLTLDPNFKLGAITVTNISPSTNITLLDRIKEVKDTFYKQYTTIFDKLKNRLRKDIQNKRGLYMMYDTNLNVIWYIGQTHSTKEGISKRIDKHYKRAMGIANDNNMGHTKWEALNQWRSENNYAFEENCEIFCIDIPNIAKEELDIEEAKLIKEFLPIMNNGSNYQERLDKLSINSNITNKPIEEETVLSLFEGL